MHPLAEKIQSRFPEAFVGAKEFCGDLSVQIKKESVVEVCRYLHDDPEMNFDYIVHISSVDWPEADERFEMVYEFYSIPRRQRIRLKTRVTEEDCTIDSVIGI